MATFKSSSMLSNNSSEESGCNRSPRESPDQLLDSDDHQEQKENDEPAILESQAFYTSPESDKPLTSDEILSDKAPLLSDHLQYQDAASHPVDVEKEGGSPGKTRTLDAVEGGEPETSYPRSQKWWKILLWGALTCFFVCNVFAIRCYKRGGYSNDSFASHSSSQDEIDSDSRLSRDIIVDSGASPILGKFPLYDLLSLSTTSGTIAVSIDPQPADSSDPLKPARVVIRSQSGSVSVSFSSPRAASMPEFERQIELDELNKKGNLDAMEAYSEKTRAKNYGSDANESLPSRPYEVDIETTSGSVTGRYMFSTAASIRTGSGSISAQLVPVVSHSDASISGATNVSLTTSTITGSTVLHLTEPYFTHNIRNPTDSDKPPPGAHEGHHYSPATAATSSHTSTGSGSLHISYPQSWAGRVLASSSGHGGIRVGGNGVELQNPGSKEWVAGHKKPEIEPGDRVWWGSKGNMNTSVKAEGSGSIQFWVGR